MYSIVHHAILCWLHHLEITSAILVVPEILQVQTLCTFHLQPDVYKGEILHIVHQLIYVSHQH